MCWECHCCLCPCACVCIGERVNASSLHVQEYVLGGNAASVHVHVLMGSGSTLKLITVVQLNRSFAYFRLDSKIIRFDKTYFPLM